MEPLCGGRLAALDEAFEARLKALRPEETIPALIKLYNEHTFTEGGFIAPMVISTLPEDKLPSACVGCRSCEEVCPQQIKVSEIMADFTEKLKG